MKLDISDIVKNTAYVGQTFYVCDYRQPDLNIKAIRHVKPTKIQICDASEYVGNRIPNVYYSSVYLIPVSSKGTLSWSKSMNPYDNTSYRHRTGEPLNIFTEKQECIDFYNQQVRDIADRLDYKIEYIVQSIINQRDAVLQNLIG